MNKYLIVLTLVMAGMAMAFSCNNRTKPSVVKGKTLKFETMANGNYSGLEKPAETVIDNQSDLTRTWMQIYKGQDPKPRPPKVDFEKDMVILVAMGTKNTGGYSIEITEISANEDFVQVNIREKSPSGMATMALTQPYHLVKLEKRTEKVVFKRS